MARRRIEIRGDGFLLRPWRKGDEASLVECANNRKVWLNLTDRFPHPYTPGHAAEWIRGQRGRAADHFAIDVDEQAIGAIGFERGFDVHARTATIGYWLGEAYWGRGIATAALQLVTDHAFANFELDRLEASVFEWNPASRRVLEKAGYELEARHRRSVFKDGHVMDAFVYAKLR